MCTTKKKKKREKRYKSRKRKTRDHKIRFPQELPRMTAVQQGKGEV